MANMKFENTLEFASDLDAKDILKKFRQRFFIPQYKGKDVIYLTGNSLGLQPKTVSLHVQQELDDWARLGVEGHLLARNPWLTYHELFPRQLGRIVGGQPHEIVVMNQLTVNLHLLMVSFYRPTRRRFKIICEARAFSSDQYAFESQAKYHGLDPDSAIIEVSPRVGEHTLRTDDIVSVIEQHGDTTAAVIFGGVNYYTGQYYDLKAITEAAHRVGAYAGFDLAHAAGNVDLHLHDWGVDFACWCSYKYLNSGPGAVAGVFIHEKHVKNDKLPRFAGWWGYTKETRFNMEKGFEPIPTAEGWQVSNAPILSMAAHKASLNIFDEAGMDKLHRKRLLMTAYLHFILQDLNNRLPEKIIEIITPENENERGAQVSMLMLQNGNQLFEGLIARGVIADWREPNVIRAAPVPLYNTFGEVWNFGNILGDLIGD
jgi:kynureninase